MDQAEHAKRLKELNRRNQNLWRIQQHNFQEDLASKPGLEAAAVSGVYEKAAKKAQHEEREFHRLEKILAPTPKRLGRPKEVGLQMRVKLLKDEGKSWTKLTQILNAETGVNRSVGGYRTLYRTLLASLNGKH